MVTDRDVLHFSNAYVTGFKLVSQVIKDQKLLLSGPLQHENPVQRHIHTLCLPWAEAKMRPCVKNTIFHLTTHSFVFTFKEMAVFVMVYFKVECIIPRRLTVK